jgi:hypothetical protein
MCQLDLLRRGERRWLELEPRVSLQGRPQCTVFVHRKLMPLGQRNGVEIRIEKPQRRSHLALISGAKYRG